MKFGLLFLINSSLAMQEKEGDLLVELPKEEPERDSYYQAKKLCNELYGKHPGSYKSRLQEALEDKDERLKLFLSCMVPDEELGYRESFKQFFKSPSYSQLLFWAEKYGDETLHERLLYNTQYLVGSPHK